MSTTLADIGLVDWANTVIGLVGLGAAGFALLQTRRSNKAAAEANSISGKGWRRSWRKGNPARPRKNLEPLRAPLPV